MNETLQNTTQTIRMMEKRRKKFRRLMIKRVNKKGIVIYRTMNYEELYAIYRKFYLNRKKALFVKHVLGIRLYRPPTSESLKAIDEAHYFNKNTGE